ncbi:MAG: hypothetical protein ABI883_03470 [Chthoniobacterales bacterium]
MDTPTSPAVAPRRPRMSAEALLGTGITIGTLGVLCLLLGWAQTMREEKSAALILLILGAVLFVLGSVVSLAGRSARKS